MLERPRNLTGPIVVTGHTGFKGTWLMLLLREIGYEAIGISLPAEPNSMYSRLNLKGVFQELFLDISNFDNLQKVIEKIQPRAIIHMAAQSLVIKSYKETYRTFESNVLGTANICEISKQSSSIRSLLIVTTDKVYENINSGKKFVESDSLRGGDPYSASKVATESIANMWQQYSNFNSSLDILTLRAGNVIGGGDFAENRLFPDLMRHIFFGEDIKIRNPLSTRPWQHVLDPLYGYIKALNKSLLNEIARNSSFNFATSEPSKTVAWAVSEINKISGMSISIDRDAISSKWKESVFLNLDPSKAHADLDWKAKWSQEGAIIKTYDWWEDVIKRKMHPLARTMQDITEYLTE